MLGQALARDRIAALISEVWPQVGAADAALLAGTLVRLAISHALLPSGDPDDAAAGVSRLLAPFVDFLLARQPDFRWWPSQSVDVIRHADYYRRACERIAADLPKHVPPEDLFHISSDRP